MKLSRVLALLFVLFLIFLSSNNSSVASEVSFTNSSERIIVKFRPFIPKYFKDRLVSVNDSVIEEKLKLQNTYVLSVPKELSHKISGQLQKSILVEYAELDYEAEAFIVPNDTLISEQWALEKLDLYDAWDISTGSDSVDIAVLDTGVNMNHSDLQGKVSLSVNCTYGFRCRPYYSIDSHGHGTHVAGIIAASTNNGKGVAGASWQSNILSVKVLTDNGFGYYSWIVNGVIWATDNGAEIINLSLGGNSYSQTLSDAIRYANENGVVVIAASGNNASNTPTYPANLDNVVSVAATDRNDLKSSFSNYGSWVDVAAPGVSIISTYKSGYEYLSGTSMAAPYVSGVVSLIIAYHPQFNSNQVVETLLDSVDLIDGSGVYWSYGRINACRALDCDGVVMPTPSLTPVPSVTFTPTPSLSPTSTPYPTFTPTPQPTPTATPTPTPTTTVTPTPTPLPSSTPTPTPQPTTGELPWWCKHVPWHYTCQ